MAAGDPRTINFPLMAALLVAPILTVWLLLIPGYARSTRIAAFTYALVPLAMRLMVAGLEGVPA